MPEHFQLWIEQGVGENCRVIRSLNRFVVDSKTTKLSYYQNKKALIHKPLSKHYSSSDLNFLFAPHTCIYTCWDHDPAILTGPSDQVNRAL